MTEPSQPTISVVEPAPEEEVVEEQPIPNAPSYIVCAPHVGSTDVTVMWGEPNEGPADTYFVEVGGASLEVPGDTSQVVVSGLPSGQPVRAKVTARYASDATSDAALETPDDPAVMTYDENNQPQDAPTESAPATDAPTGA